MRSNLRENFDSVATDYRRYRVGFPESLMPRLAAYEIGLPGQRVIDLGTGTGALARLFAVRGCHVVGIDPAQRLLEQARELDREANLAVDYRATTAESTGLPAAEFDVVTAGQAWHWFDRPIAAREARRLLVPGGHIVIAHFDWLPLDDNVVACTEALITDHNPSWHLGGGTGLYPAWLTDLSDAQFQGIETFSYDVNITYSQDAWVGRVRASAGISALDTEARRQYSNELSSMIRDRFSNPLVVPHRIWAVVALKPMVHDV